MPAPRSYRAKTGKLGKSRADLYANSIVSWGAIQGKEQTRFTTLANDHAHECAFCASVSAQVAEGRSVSPKQAAVLMEKATRHGWPVPVVGGK